MAFSAGKSCTVHPHAARSAEAGPFGTRRRFMRALGAMSTVGVLPACAGMGASSAAPKLIDTHHHLYPPEYDKARLAWEDARKLPHSAEVAGW